MLQANKALKTRALDAPPQVKNQAVLDWVAGIVALKKKYKASSCAMAVPPSACSAIHKPFWTALTAPHASRTSGCECHDGVCVSIC